MKSDWGKTLLLCSVAFAVMIPAETEWGKLLNAIGAMLFIVLWRHAPEEKMKEKENENLSRQD